MSGLLVAIDPGHGGKDPGALGPSGTKEADIALFAAGFLEVALREVGHRTLVTRQGDVFVDLAKRARIANEAGADVFVSLHCNGFHDPAAHGTETLYYPGSEQGKRLADYIQWWLAEEMETRDRGIKPRGDLAVLKRTTMPAVLVELEFITRPEGEANLRSPEWLRRAARAIAQGIDDWSGRSP